MGEPIELREDGVVFSGTWHGVAAWLHLCTTTDPTIRARWRADAERLVTGGFAKALIDDEGRIGVWTAVPDGVPLSDLVAGGRPSLEEVDAIGRALITGAAALHQAGIRAPGLDAADVWISGTRVTFGGLPSPRPPPEAVVAPELSKGEVPDARADIHSLGMWLYLLAVGSPPFPPDPDEARIACANARFRRPRDGRPDLPDAIDRAIVSALEPDRSYRAPDAGRLLAVWSGEMADWEQPSGLLMMGETPPPVPGGTVPPAAPRPEILPAPVPSANASATPPAVRATGGPVPVPGSSRPPSLPPASEPAPAALPPSQLSTAVPVEARSAPTPRPAPPLSPQADDGPNPIVLVVAAGAAVLVVLLVLGLIVVGVGGVSSSAPSPVVVAPPPAPPPTVAPPAEPAPADPLAAAGIPAPEALAPPEVPPSGGTAPAPAAAAPAPASAGSPSPVPAAPVGGARPAPAPVAPAPVAPAPVAPAAPAPAEPAPAAPAPAAPAPAAPAPAPAAPAPAPAAPAPAAASGPPVVHRSLVTFKLSPKPVYPEGQRDAGEVVCLATVEIDARGTPTSVSVSKCADAFAEATRSAMLKARFEPPVVDGRNTAVVTTLPLKFAR